MNIKENIIIVLILRLRIHFILNKQSTFIIGTQIAYIFK